MHERVTGTTALQFFAALDKAIDAAGTGQYRSFKLLSELESLGLEVVTKEFPPPSRGVGTDSVPDLGQRIIDARGVTA